MFRNYGNFGRKVTKSTVYAYVKKGDDPFDVKLICHSLGARQSGPL